VSESKVPWGFYNLVGLGPGLLGAENLASRASRAPRPQPLEVIHIALQCIRADVGEACMSLTRLT
jgi:hypothetical protein